MRLWDKGYTPINSRSLQKILASYPDQEVAAELLDGFSNAFRLKYTGPRIHTFSKNLLSAEQHKNETLLKLQNEIKLGRILGLFKNMPISTLQISPIGLVPKPDGNWRLNTNLSHPPSKGIHSYIDPEFCKVNYSSLDSILEMIYNCGKSAELANIDIKPAFRPLIVNSADFDLLGIKFDNMYYIDKSLHMGCSVSCNLFEQFSSFLQWIVETRCGLHSIDHYLDDFILVGK